MFTAATLFLSPVKTYALFEQELSRSHDTRARAGGFLGFYSPRSISNWGVVVESSYLSGLLFRDTIHIDGLVREFDFKLDTVFIPGFTAYDESGIAESGFPVAGVLGASWRSGAGIFLWELGLYGGFEHIDSYYTFLHLFGLSASASVILTPALALSLYAALPAARDVTTEAAVRFSPASWWTVTGGLEMRGLIKTLKLALDLNLGRDFTGTLGGSYTLDYGGWNVSGGVFFRNLGFITRGTDLSAAFSYNQTGGADITLALEFRYLHLDYLIMEVVTNRYGFTEKRYRENPGITTISR